MAAVDHGVIAFNRALCTAVKAHSCIYDRNDPNFMLMQAVNPAWLEIAKQCGESVQSCKLRWRSIRSVYMRSLQTRQGRVSEYYLHDAIDFLLPHLGPYNDRVSPEDNESQHDGAVGTKARQKTSPSSVMRGKKAVETVAAPMTDATPEKEAEPSVGRSSRLIEKASLGVVIRTTPTNAGNNSAPPMANNGTSELSDERLRFRRSCKRGLDGTVVRELRLRHSEPNAKRKKRSLERAQILQNKSAEGGASLPAAQPAVAKKLLKDTELHGGQQQQPISQRSKTLQPQNTFQDQLGAIKLLESSSDISTESTELSLPDGTAAMENCGVQCNLLVDSVPATTQAIGVDFLAELQPQVAMMNARQQMVFRTKMLGVLSEVLDDARDFPHAGDVVCNAPATEKPAPSWELLMRELVGSMAATKQTPNAIAASTTALSAAHNTNNSNNSIQVSPPAPAAVDSNIITTPTSTSATTRPLHHIIKMPSVTTATNAAGGQTSQPPRIFRIYPSGLPPVTRLVVAGPPNNSNSSTADVIGKNVVKDVVVQPVPRLNYPTGHIALPSDAKSVAAVPKNNSNNNVGREVVVRPAPRQPGQPSDAKSVVAPLPKNNNNNNVGREIVVRPAPRQPGQHPRLVVPAPPNNNNNNNNSSAGDAIYKNGNIEVMARSVPRQQCIASAAKRFWVSNNVDSSQAQGRPPRRYSVCGPGVLTASTDDGMPSAKRVKLLKLPSAANSSSSNSTKNNALTTTPTTTTTTTTTTAAVSGPNHGMPAGLLRAALGSTLSRHSSGDSMSRYSSEDGGFPTVLKIADANKKPVVINLYNNNNNNNKDKNCNSSNKNVRLRISGRKPTESPAPLVTLPTKPASAKAIAVTPATAKATTTTTVTTSKTTAAALVAQVPYRRDPRKLPIKATPEPERNNNQIKLTPTRPTRLSSCIAGILAPDNFDAEADVGIKEEPLDVN